MSNSAKDILEKVGGTPLVEISGKLNKGGATVGPVQQRRGFP